MTKLLSIILGLSEVDNTTKELIVTPETTTIQKFDTINTSELQNIFLLFIIL